jgi:putative nucleotidyltransferase with HDIG domain
MIGDKLEKLRSKIQALEVMPTIPVILLPLAEMFRKTPDEIDVEKVVELVAYDKTIAAQCLRLANSPLFGRQQIESVRAAVLALGLKRVQAILLGGCLNATVPPGQWVLDPITFWRHSLGCALVSRKMAQLIGYPDVEKAYLAGLMHDLGILINSLVVAEEFRKCFQSAVEEHLALDRAEEQHLGFTHCQTGRILAEQWNLPSEIAEVIEFHHNVAMAHKAEPLVALVHLSDLLCRVRELGYGYYEVMGIDLAGGAAWATLRTHCPKLASLDLARLSLDIDGAMAEIVSLVNAVFQPQLLAASTGAKG